jgi:hypothetical protein
MVVSVYPIVTSVKNYRTPEADGDTAAPPLSMNIGSLIFCP